MPLRKEDVLLHEAVVCSSEPRQRHEKRFKVALAGHLAREGLDILREYAKDLG